MNLLLENLTKWVAVATICALIIAITHEYGYFSVVGAHFQTVATTYDYLVNALVWLPSTFVMATVIFGFRDWITEPQPHRWPRPPKILAIIVASLLVISSIISFFSGSNFAYEFAYIISLGAVYTGLCVYAFHYSHINWEYVRTLLFIPVVLCFSFAYGSMLAYTDLRNTNDVYFLTYKTSSVVRPVVMLRGFERGLLIRDHMHDRVELVRWDELVSFSRFASSKKERSLACRLVKVGCDPASEPRI